MDLGVFFETAGIPAFLVIGFGYYAYKVLVFKDPKVLRGDKGRKLKNEKAYLDCAGKLLAFMAIASAGMAALSFWNRVAAFVEILICFLIFSVLWKRMHKKYGDIDL